VKKKKVYDPRRVLQLARYNPIVDDCAVWCLATFLGVSYERVIATSAKFDKNGGIGGLTIPKMLLVAERLGFPLQRRNKPDLEHDTGILSIDLPRQKNRGHVVVLKQGLVLDVMSGRSISLWDVDVYLSSKRARVDGILVSPLFEKEEKDS